MGEGVHVVRCRCWDLTMVLQKYFSRSAGVRAIKTRGCKSCKTNIIFTILQLITHVHVFVHIIQSDVFLVKMLIHDYYYWMKNVCHVFFIFIAYSINYSVLHANYYISCANVEESKLLSWKTPGEQNGTCAFVTVLSRRAIWEHWWSQESISVLSLILYKWSPGLYGMVLSFTLVHHYSRDVPTPGSPARHSPGKK